MWFVEVLANSGPSAVIAVLIGLAAVVVVTVWLVLAHTKGDKGKPRDIHLSIGNGKVLKLDLTNPEFVERSQLPHEHENPSQTTASRRSKRRRRGNQQNAR